MKGPIAPIPWMAFGRWRWCAARKRYVDTKIMLEWHAFDSLRNEEHFAAYVAECEAWKE